MSLSLYRRRTQIATLLQLPYADWTGPLSSSAGYCKRHCAGNVFVDTQHSDWALRRAQHVSGTLTTTASRQTNSNAEIPEAWHRSIACHWHSNGKRLNMLHGLAGSTADGGTSVRSSTAQSCDVRLGCVKATLGCGSRFSTVHTCAPVTSTRIAFHSPLPHQPCRCQIMRSACCEEEWASQR